MGNNVAKGLFIIILLCLDTYVTTTRNEGFSNLWVGFFSVCERVAHSFLWLLRTQPCRLLLTFPGEEAADSRKSLDVLRSFL